ncbi:YebG family protein [Pseudocolwellia sp. AS88]|uniref:YebG family protein n=1 Tax=Pseudocolwellia TaxID=2848177 RepID=UPI0026F2AD74|nr:YebG family protein [Pseudocolwellia sp. AS88]MDO7085426.1 YebG family protein [Pseudocolwellia sp. AS88]
MAVESRFVVIRHGVEVQTFMDKKAADEYDKMLDMADNLTAMLDSTPFDLSDEVKEDLSIYLAQNREDVLVALQAKKAKPAPKAAVKPKAQAEPKVETPIAEVAVEETITTETVEAAEVVKEKPAPKKAVRKTKSKTASDIANTPA